MEGSRKSEGFLKRKLLKPILYPAAINSSAKNAVIKPSTSSTGPPAAASTWAAASVGFVVNHDYVTPQQKQTVLLFPQQESGGRDVSYHKVESFYNGVDADDSVDLKAAYYISCVQARFRLE